MPEADVKDGAKISTKLSNVSDWMPKAKGEKKRETNKAFFDVCQGRRRRKTTYCFKKNRITKNELSVS